MVKVNKYHLIPLQDVSTIDLQIGIFVWTWFPFLPPSLSLSLARNLKS